MRLMILGAGVMQIPAILAAKELGVETFVADRDSLAPGAPLADRFEPVDLKDRDALVDAALRLQRSGDAIDGVFTAGTDFSANVAYIAEKLGLSGHSYRAALDASDKIRMRSAFERSGAPSPRFFEVSDAMSLSNVIQSAKKLLNDGPCDLVIKPADNMGGRGVIRARDYDALEAAITGALASSRSRRAIVEEYLDGREFSIDALIIDGKITICGVADRRVYFPPYFIEMGHTIPAALSEEEQKALIDAFTAGVHALGLTHGAAKGDMKLTSKGAYIGEIAARLSGGYMSGWTFPLASGVNLTKTAIKLALGLPVTGVDTRPSCQNVCAERAFASIPGRAAQITGLTEAEKSAGVSSLFTRIREGDTVAFPHNNVEKCGNVLAVGATYREACDRANDAIKKIFIRLEKGEERTRRYLLEDDSNEPDFSREENEDGNGLSAQEISEKFREMTGVGEPSYRGSKRDRFLRAKRRGGLQGAVWFFDTFGA